MRRGGWGFGPACAYDGGDMTSHVWLASNLQRLGFTEAARNLAKPSIYAERAWRLYTEAEAFIDVDGKPWRAVRQLKQRPMVT